MESLHENKTSDEIDVDIDIDIDELGTVHENASPHVREKKRKELKETWRILDGISGQKTPKRKNFSQISSLANLKNGYGRPAKPVWRKKEGRNYYTASGCNQKPVGVLMCLAFLRDDINRTITSNGNWEVGYKNGDRANDELDNLMVVPHGTANTKPRTRVVHDTTTIQDEDGEIWQELTPVIMPSITKIMDRYPQISNHGRCKTAAGKLTKGKLMERQRFYNTQTFNHTSAGRLVAYGFLDAAAWDNAGKKWNAFHINGKAAGDHVDNIQIVTPSEARSRAFKVSGVKRKSPGPKRMKRILQIDDITGDTIREWPSMMDADRDGGFNRRNVWSCCNKKIKTAYGFKWKFAPDTIDGEIWTKCTIPEFEGMSWSTMGRIETTKTARTFGVIADGYMHVGVRRTQRFVHQIIAREAMPDEYTTCLVRCPPNDPPQVDHLDRNRSNNKLENLKWVTRIENLQNKSSV